MKHLLLIVLLPVSLGACASYDAREHARVLNTALKDDQACNQQGWRYPEYRYVSCRMQLQDDRLHQDWLNLQLMRQGQTQPPNVPSPYIPREHYRPMDPDHFDCRLVTEDKRDYILCDPTDDAEKP